MVHRKDDDTAFPLIRQVVWIASVLTLLAFPAGLPFANPTQQPNHSASKILLPSGARHFGIGVLWKSAERKISLSYGNHRAEILVGSDRIMVDDSILMLSSPVTAGEGAITMTVSDSAKLFSHMLNRNVTEREIVESGLILRQRPVAVEEGRVESIRYISYPRFTRLFINLSSSRDIEDIEINHSKGPRTLTLEFPHCRLAQALGPIDVGDRIVNLIEPIEERTGVTLTVRTATEKTDYEIEKFDNPSRVVIDIRPPSPTIMTDFLHADALQTQANGWTEPEHARRLRQVLFTTIVIDPGHGGKDRGASGHGGLLEKDVTLGIALKLRKALEQMPGTKVILTRTGDYSMSLRERTAIANRAKEGLPADLFISIHTNAHRNEKIGGFETHYFSCAGNSDTPVTTPTQRVVSTINPGMDTPSESGTEPILWNRQFEKFVSQSSDFAFTTQGELDRRLNIDNRGIRGAQFVVLAGVAMPSILVEVGFISNRIEEAKLGTTDFGDKCAEALAAAVELYRERHRTRLGYLNREPNP